MVSRGGVWDVQGRLIGSAEERIVSWIIGRWGFFGISWILWNATAFGDWERHGDRGVRSVENCGRRKLACAEFDWSFEDMVLGLEGCLGVVGNFGSWFVKRVLGLIRCVRVMSITYEYG